MKNTNNYIYVVEQMTRINEMMVTNSRKVFYTEEVAYDAFRDDVSDMELRCVGVKGDVTEKRIDEGCFHALIVGLNGIYITIRMRKEVLI